MVLKANKVLLKYPWFPIVINQISTRIVDIMYLASPNVRMETTCPSRDQGMMKIS